MDTTHDTPDIMKKSIPRAEAEVTDTIKIQVGKNATDIEYLKKQVGDLSDVKIKMAQMSEEMKMLKSDYASGQEQSRKDISALEKNIDRLGDGIRGQRSLLWKIFLGIPATLAVGLVISGLLRSSYQDRIDLKIQTVTEKHSITDSILQHNVNDMKKDIKDINTRINSGFNEIKNIIINKQ